MLRRQGLEESAVEKRKLPERRDRRPTRRQRLIQRVEKEGAQDAAIEVALLCARLPQLTQYKAPVAVQGAANLQKVEKHQPQKRRQRDVVAVLSVLGTVNHLGT